MSDMGQDGYSTSEIAQKTGVTLRQLYYWELIGLIRPAYQKFGLRQFRRYGQNDFERLLEIKAWLDVGYTLEAVKTQMGSDPQKGSDPFCGEAQ